MNRITSVTKIITSVWQMTIEEASKRGREPTAILLNKTF